MHVHRVRPPAAGVLQLPDLDGAAGHFGEHALVDLAEGHAVDAPFAAGALEVEVVVGGGCGGDGWWEGYGAEGGGDGGGVGDGGAGDYELEDFVGVEVGRVRGEVLGVAERDVLASEGREVDDDLVALGHGYVQGVGADGARGQAGVRGDDLEGDLGCGTRGALEVQQECPRDGGVEEPQAILARLDLEIGPWLAVDVDYVSEETVRHSGGREESAV